MRDMVLLKKNDAFPLERPGTLAAYGNGIRHVKYVIGDENKYGILAVSVMLPTMVGVILAPNFLKRFGKVKTTAVSCFICAGWEPK